jgi:hypothetical protein
LFGRGNNRRDFDREVEIEVQYLRRLHGEQAAQVAREKAVRPNQRTMRRKVLEAAAARLAREEA